MTLIFNDRACGSFRPGMVAPCNLAGLGDSNSVRGGDLFRLNVLGHCFHRVGVEVLDHSVHDGRVTKLLLDDVELSQHVRGVLASQAREDRCPLCCVAVAGRAGDSRTDMR